jgi:hypothetical protein
MKKNDDYKKVRKFISGLTPSEFRCAELTIQFVNAYNDLIKRHQLTKEDFCELFSVKPSNYNNFIKGCYNYTVTDMAILNSVHAKLEAKKSMESEIVKITGENKE